MTSHSNATRHRAAWALAGMVLVSLASGCQVHVGGQTLPSPWYHNDDVQYYAPGPEFKLTREAAAMKEFKAEAAAAR